MSPIMMRRTAHAIPDGQGSSPSSITAELTSTHSIPTPTSTFATYTRERSRRTRGPPQPQPLRFITTTKTLPTATPQINNSKLNTLEIPNPPSWVIYFLAACLLFGFLLAGLLVCVAFPPRFRECRFWRRVTFWRRARKHRGQGQYCVLRDDEDEGGAWSSASPHELGRRRNFKGLKVRTEGIGYRGLPDVEGGDPPEEEMCKLDRDWDMDGRSARVGETRGFLASVGNGIESAAEWFGRVLHREVRGAEEGLLLPVRDCEREGKKGW